MNSMFRDSHDDGDEAILVFITQQSDSLRKDTAFPISGVVYAIAVNQIETFPRAIVSSAEIKALFPRLIFSV